MILVGKVLLDNEPAANAGTRALPHLIRFGEGQGIDQVQGQVQGAKVRKVFRNGILFILRNGKTYNAQGAEIR